MTEKIGWKKKRKPVATNLDVFSNDFNYKNIQLPEDTPIVEGLTPSINETGLSTDTPVSDVPSSGPAPNPDSDPDNIGIPEWKMPDSAYIPKVPENKDTQHPGIWAFSRLLNRTIDQLNWFLKYFYGTATALSQPEPNAIEVLWSLILIIIIFIVQVIFLLPNIISYFTEFIGICFAAIIFEMIGQSEAAEKYRENYRQGIDSSIEGMNGIVGTCVAFLVTLNIWHSIAHRESEKDIVSTIESWMSKTLFGFFRHGLAGALLLNHMFGRMKMGKTMQESNETMLGGGMPGGGMPGGGMPGGGMPGGGMPGGGMPEELPGGLSDLMNGVPLGVRASNATARQYEKFIDSLKANPTVSFIVLFLIIFSSFMGGGFAKLMDSQNTIKSAMGDGGGSPVWYIIVIFCMIASGVSFLAVLPSSFNITAPLLSGFYILMLLIATLVTFQLGSIGSIMILFYFMFMVIPLEEFGRWGIIVDTIFNSFKPPKPDPDMTTYKKIFLYYGVIIVFALAIMGSFTRMMVNVSKSMPTKLSGGVFGFGVIGLLLTLLVLYKFVFPKNITELFGILFPRAKTHTQSAPYTTANNNPVGSPLGNALPDTNINYGRTIHSSDVANEDTSPIRKNTSIFSMFGTSNKPPNNGPITRHKSIWDYFK